MKFSSLIAATLLVASLVCTANAQVPERLQRNCITVRAQNSSGSGTFVKRGDDLFIWTAHHVIDGLRYVESNPNGGTKKKIGYRDAELVTEIQFEGRTVGDTRLKCKVLICSPKLDIAVLQVRGPASLLPDVDGIEFDLSGELVPIATELYHCGSPSGQEMGHNSITDGIVSANGRMFDYTSIDLPYMQTSCSALPGSSGGIVATKAEGKYVGMLTLGIRGTDTFNYCVEARRIVEWCDDNEIRFLVDPDAPVLSDEDLLELPIEDELRKEDNSKAAADAEDEGLYFPLFHFGQTEASCLIK